MTTGDNEIAKPGDKKVASEAGLQKSSEFAINDSSQQKTLCQAQDSNPNNIPAGDSVGQNLAALKPGMTLTEARQAQQQVEIKAFGNFRVPSWQARIEQGART